MRCSNGNKRLEEEPLPPRPVKQQRHQQPAEYGEPQPLPLSPTATSVGDFRNLEDEAARGRFRLEDADLDCLKPKGKVTDKVFAVLLDFLQSAALSTTVLTMRCGTEPAWDQVDGSAKAVNLAIHTPATDASPDHWCLLVMDSDNPRLLDPDPTQARKEAAEKALAALPTDRFVTWKRPLPPIKEVKCPQGVDSEIFLVVNVLGSLAGATGSDISDLGAALDLWRDVCYLLLKLAKGESWHLPWDQFETKGLLMATKPIYGPLGTVFQEYDKLHQDLAGRWERIRTTAAERVSRAQAIAEILRGIAAAALEIDTSKIQSMRDTLEPIANSTDLQRSLAGLNSHLRKQRERGWILYMLKQAVNEIDDVVKKIELGVAGPIEAEAQCRMGP